MRLLFIIDCFGSGGAQRQMVSLAVGLKNRGHDIEFFIYHPELSHFRDFVLNNGIKINEFYKKHRISIKLFGALRSIIKNGNYDLVLSFLDAPNFYAEITSLGLNIPIIVSERSVYPRKLTIPKWLMEQFHRLSDHIVVNSFFQKEMMIKVFSWMANRISVIYNGVDTEIFKPVLTKKKGDILNLIAISSVSRNKNVINLIKAIYFCKKNYKFRLKIKWVGRISDNKYYEVVNKLIAELGLQEAWDWLGERNDIAELINAADALIHPSFYEGLPNVICEAFACGKPVLASNVCEIPKLVEDGQRGFLFNPYDATDIAKVIYKFNNLDDNTIRKISHNAREFAIKSLSIEKVLHDFEDLILNVLIYSNKKKYF
jgi:glycosyltransferase involved in cell wall biosynthesis